ncbi:MAG: AI-2E family transporter, partial [Deltaproteobacteria bacterium]|nr:AI-2E family transporter [Deltaproteobacteria bacterium]
MNKVAAKESLLPPRWVLVLVATAAVLWLLFALKEIVAMLVLGYAIAYAMDPMLRFLERRKISRSVGFFVLCGLFLIALCLLVVTAVPTVVREYEKLSDNFPEYLQRAVERAGPILSDLRSRLPAKMRSGGDVLANPGALLSHLSSENIHAFLAGIGSALLQGYSVTLTILNFLLLPFITYYLAVDLPLFHAWVLSLFPSSRRRRVAEIAREIDGHISAFVRGQLTVGTILFVLYLIGLGIVGVELWFLLAVIAGFGAIIPYLGFLAG